MIVILCLCFWLLGRETYTQTLQKFSRLGLLLKYTVDSLIFFFLDFEFRLDHDDREKLRMRLEHVGQWTFILSMRLVLCDLLI